MEEQQQQPHVVIPATEQTIMHGVKQQLCPRIMECSQEGFIVVFQGQGVAARSSWQEVLTCIEEVGYAHLNIARPEPVIPAGIDPTIQGESREAQSFGSRLHSSLMTAAAVASTILVALSVKIT